MRALEKPDFDDDQSGGWIDINFLPQAVHDELKHHIGKAQLPEVKVKKFLNSCNEFVQVIHADRDTTGQDRVKMEIEKIANDAHRLLAAINSASPQARQCLELFNEEQRGDVAENEILPLAWDCIQALEKAATYSADQIKPDRQNKPTLTNSRRLAGHVVGAYWRYFNALPPSNQAGWFAGFMTCLGDHCGMQCGPRIVSGAIRTVKKTMHH